MYFFSMKKYAQNRDVSHKNMFNDASLYTNVRTLTSGLKNGLRF